MASGWAQRAARKASRYLEEAFSEPGVLKNCQEELFSLKEAAGLSQFMTITDHHLGGLTTAKIEHEADDGGCMSFEGDYSSVVSRDAPAKVHKLGQATVASKLSGGCYLDFGTFERQVATDLRIRLKGDGRLYLAFLKTDSYCEGEGTYDIWQTYLRIRPDEWQDLTIPLTEFLLTSDGHVVEETVKPNLERVAGLGFSVAGGSELQENGPFKLQVSSIAVGYSDDRSMDE